jgi:hypothetical protein
MHIHLLWLCLRRRNHPCTYSQMRIIMTIPMSAMSFGKAIFIAFMSKILIHGKKDDEYMQGTA